MYPNIGYEMDWDEIDHLLDFTPKGWKWDDWSDEIDQFQHLQDITVLCKSVWDRRPNGALFVSVAIGG